MRRMLVALIVAVVPTVSAHADDYYVAVFSAEAVPYKPELTHSFAAAVRVSAGGAAEVVGISWLPASLNPRGLTLAPEAGVNLGIPDTVAWAQRLGMRVSVWGPFRIDAELFCRLKAQAERLGTGRVRYKPTDTAFPAALVQNCYHALWMPVAPLRARGVSGAFSAGDAASGVTVGLYAPWVVEPCRTHDAVLGLLGVAECGLTRRAFDDRPTRRDAVRSWLDD
ncbi:MAG: hypothetical protein U0804_03920 [Gemmataceae bacterium]